MGCILHNFQCLNYKGVPTNWSFNVLQGFQPVQTQTRLIVRGLKFQINAVKELHYLCCENNGADKLCG